MDTTRRRFDSIITRLATGSPRSIRFASATSSAAVSSLCRPTSARKSWRLSAALKELGVLFTNVVLQHERLELGGFELPAVLLGTLDEGLHVLRFKELYELVLRQRPVSVLSNLFHDATNLRSV